MLILRERVVTACWDLGPQPFRLLCAAAVGVSADREARIDALIKAGVDVIAIDTANHGSTQGLPAGGVLFAAHLREAVVWDSPEGVVFSSLEEAVWVDHLAVLRPHLVVSTGDHLSSVAAIRWSGIELRTCWR